MKIHFYINVRLPRRKAHFILVLIFLQLVACPVWGQVLQKRELRTVDYEKWGNLQLNKMDAKGLWISYSMSYESKLDTLFIKNIRSLETHSFPSGSKGDFIDSNWFVCQTANGLDILNLNNGVKEIIADVTQYHYSPVIKRLFILISDKQKGNRLLIRKLNEVHQVQIEGVVEFLIDPNSQMMLYTTQTEGQYAINLLELSGKQHTTILRSSHGNFNNLTWNTLGHGLAFMEKTPDNDEITIYYYNVAKKKLYDYSSSAMRKSLGDSLSISTTAHKLKISDSNQQVFFTVQPKKKSKNSTEDSDVQIWNGNAKWIFPMEEKQKIFRKPYLALWSPTESRDHLISSASFPQFMLTGDQKYALLSNEKQYEPQFKYSGLRDFYLVNLSNGKTTLLIKENSGHAMHVIPSPGGKYISYFRQNNWWIYDIAKGTHTNITDRTGHCFFNNESQYPENTDTYPSIGWTFGDKEILLSDAFDIWAISPDGLSSRRLTHGRETGTKFRLSRNSSATTQRNYDGRIHPILYLSEGLLLEASNEKMESGYYKWMDGFTEELVYSRHTLLDQLVVSKTGNSFVYREQDYDLPPRIMIAIKGKNLSEILFKSNSQHEKFYWGKSKLIHYTNKKGQLLKGILYYPSQYNSQKKYPMIVSIYERQSQDLNKYINPSQFTGDGVFNISTFTTQGYFVLAPDISYEIGNPGFSAYDCVVSATNEILKTESILPNKIGLIGHSFGGYETNFIITQTNLFATAVAGSAPTNLTSFYLTVGGKTGQPDMWRFESQQLRMGKSLFEDWEGYQKNSPIMHAKNITTPLLSWTGDADMQVNWTQSIEFYLALRRLKKQHIMLLYPKEQHSLDNPKNQKDLSIKLHEWFDYHLKDTTPAAWIKKGLQYQYL